jgi:thiaminase/transcriptional activator TenA
MKVGLKPSVRMREAAAPIWSAILEHPYLTELAAGTLPRSVFRDYVKQDWLYLTEFLRATAAIAARAADPGLMKTLLKRVEWLIGMENHFHHKHAAELGLDFERIDWQMNDANYAYTRHMLWAAHAGTTVEALGALMPCPCVYIHVGEVLTAAPRPPDPLYAEWIEFYGPGPIAERTRQLEAIFDRLAEHASPDELARAEQNYLISSRYEWMFWDAALNPRGPNGWPV